MEFDGPWRKVAHDMYMMDGDEPIAVENAKGDTVCNNAPFYPAALEAKYADLIAAAPELYTHAKWVMAMLEEHGPSIVPHLLDSDQNAGQRLRDAIAKAEGRA